MSLYDDRLLRAITFVFFVSSSIRYSDRVYCGHCGHRNILKVDTDCWRLHSQIAHGLYATNSSDEDEDAKTSKISFTRRHVTLCRSFPCMCFTYVYVHGNTKENVGSNVSWTASVHWWWWRRWWVVAIPCAPPMWSLLCLHLWRKFYFRIGIHYYPKILLKFNTACTKKETKVI